MKWFGLKTPTFLMLTVVSLLQFASPDAAYQTPVAPPVLTRFNTVSGAPDINRILELVNQERVASGLAPLAVNEALTQAAQERAHDMETHSYYAHKGSDGRYYNELLKTKGSSCENLDLQFTLESEAYLQDWLHSRSHRACLLDASATQAGYAVAEMGSLFSNGQAEKSFVVVAIHASDPAVVAVK